MLRTVRRLPATGPDILTAVADPGRTPRRAGRVLVLDSADRVLLLHGFDPVRPDEPYWLVPGGGANPGESLAEAAARELREETGISASPGELGEPVWHEVTEFSFAGIAYRMEQDFFLLKIAAAEVSTDGMESDEREYSIGHRWWSVAELAAATEPFYPVALPELLARIS
jgi:8-oxo-dGTP pyrophosphatase MutT (NUDIX family)